MEEGELSDSGSETEQHVAAGAASAFIPVSRPSAPTPVEAFRKSQVPGLSSDSEDSDSDIEDGSFMKRKCNIQRTNPGSFKNPLLESKHRGPSELGFKKKEAPSKRYRDLDSMEEDVSLSMHKSRKNVWGNVLAEQVLTQEIGTFAVEKDLSALSYRNVEAYQIPRKQNITYDDVFDLSDEAEDKDTVKKEKKSAEMEMETKCDDTDDKEAKEQEGLFKIETFGTIPEKEPPKLSIKDRLGGKRRDSDSDSEDDRRCKRKERTNETLDFQKELEKYALKRKRVEKPHKKKHIKDRLGKREKPPTETLPSDLIHVNENDSIEKIVQALTHNLQEPKAGLMTRVVEVLGRRKAVDLLSETISIESTGGLMIKNGSRRRTPGGVFLFLLREDRHVRKEDFNKIFEEEREIEKQHKRKILKAKRAALAQIKRPQDLFMGKNQPIRPLPVMKRTVEPQPPMGDGLDMEEGEVQDEAGEVQDDDDDDDLDLDAEIGVNIE